MRISKPARLVAHATIMLGVLLLCRTIDKEMRSYVVNSRGLEKVTASIIIMGDSHAMYGIDEKKFTNAINMAMEAESFEYTYYKLKRLTSEKNEIKKLILSVSAHSFGQPDSNKEMIKRYKWILDSNYYKVKLKYGDIDKYTLTECFSRYIFPLGFLYNACEYYGLIYKGQPPRWKGAQGLPTGSHIGNNNYLKEAIKRHYFTGNGNVRKMSKTRYLYFYRIVKLCKDRSIDLFIVTTPVWPEYYKKIPQKFLDFKLQVINSYGKNVMYYDLNEEISYFHADEFLDYDHLNQKGAKRCSELINKWLQANNEA